MPLPFLGGHLKCIITRVDIQPGVVPSERLPGLTHENEFACLNKGVCLQAIEIDAARQAAPVEPRLMLPWLYNVIYDGRYPLSKRIIHTQHDV